MQLMVKVVLVILVIYRLPCTTLFLATTLMLAAEGVALKPCVTTTEVVFNGIEVSPLAYVKNPGHLIMAFIAPPIEPSIDAEVKSDASTTVPLSVPNDSRIPAVKDASLI